MLSFSSIPILIVLLVTTDGSYYLYYTGFVSENDMYFHCVYYKVLDNIVTYYKENNKFRSPYQIISYCIRPLDDENIQNDPIMITTGEISSVLTFVEMSNRNINAQDLLSWSAPIDLIERYMNYLETKNISSISEQYNNCTEGWFGPLCEYTFDRNELFSDIVWKSFISKDLSDIPVDQMPLSCFILIECNRGLGRSCLDWREICDGNVDCVDGNDEINCLPLETNECKENEYRCHQGMCVPEHFINDNPYNPDCLDSSDENDYEEEFAASDEPFIIYLYILGAEYPNCFQDPSFRCEDTNHRFKFFVDSSVCGDGQTSASSIPHKILSSSYRSFTTRYLCHNKRVQILEKSFFFNNQSSNLSYECWSIMMCLTYLEDYIDECLQLVDEIYESNGMLIREKCNHSDYLFFPEHPAMQDHIRFGYWTNQTYVYDGFDLSLYPSFVCYDIKRCAFLPFNIIIDNFTCIDFQTLYQLDFHTLTELFRTCNYVYESGNDTDCIHPSLFHCPGTSKCISKHRLVDGIIDCYDGSDEIYQDSWLLNDKHRFQCTSENKSISFYIVRDGLRHCRAGEDEMASRVEKTVSFQILCNGYAYLPAVLTEEVNETDETNCEQWPCNNQYTRCDQAWTCSDGADEIKCNENSTCFSDSHECICPFTFQTICLPINRTGDGIVNCLGATDEREFCRKRFPFDRNMRYRCWDSTQCIRWEEPTDVLCVDTHVCSTEENSIYNRDTQKNAPFATNCTIGLNMIPVFNTLLNDRIVMDNDNLNRIHFTLDYPNHPLAYSKDEIFPESNEPLGPPVNEIDNHHHLICNRGILIWVAQAKFEYCLCPPSYYGKHCQFQSERVSLTIQFIKECVPDCSGMYTIILILIDSNKMIHSYEQLTYMTMRNCDLKHHFNFLYQSRPKDLTKNYSIHLDVYHKVDLSYYVSWIIPIPFLFLPVNRISVQMIIPSHPVGIIKSCPLACGDHGYCRIYSNTGEYFCHCHPGWSGVYCTLKENECNCSLSSICIGMINHRSICLCARNRTGPRCFLPSACQRNPCHNDGQCIIADDHLSPDDFVCVCPEGFFGRTCEEKNQRIGISFDDVKIPQALLIYFITVQTRSDPLITTLAKKVPLDEDTVSIYTSILYNMIFIEINSEYYLSYVQVKATSISENRINLKSTHYCTSIDQLLDERTIAFPILRRAKYYHIPCQKNAWLSCFHDNESFMCLCNKDRHANCFPFYFKKNSTCLGRTQCEHNGHCISNLPSCPTSTMCVCPECHYGGRCQFTTKGSGLSLDVILGYQIRQHRSIIHQPIAVKISIAMTILFLFVGLVSGTLSTLTFRSKSIREVGCGLYLFTLSIVSIFMVIMFTFKLWFLIFFQTLWITNHNIQTISCISIEFLLQSLVTIEDWLSVSISIERAWLVKQCDNSVKKKSVKIARWIIIGIIFCTLVSFIHDPLFRQLVEDKEEQRTWCIVRYSSSAKIFDSAVRIIHFIIPFSINLISALMIIFTVARSHSAARKNKTFSQFLREQSNEHKHLIISPTTLVILAIPRLIISFFSECMRSIRYPWLFLVAYFISFVPPLLVPIIFILPSQLYMGELKKIVRRWRITILQCRCCK